MTNQEIFDIVAKHLLTQNARSQDIKNIVCAYRGSNDMKCAVGVLIKDEHYSYLLEGYNVRDIDVKEALEKSGITVDSRIHFLAALQEVHDLFPVGFWRERLGEVAERYNLNLDVLDSIGVPP